MFVVPSFIIKYPSELTMKSSKQPSDTNDDGSDSHLEDIDDGCGCVEMWEQLSDRRYSSE